MFDVAVMNDENRLWQNYNELLLSGDVERIRKLLARYELFKKSLEVPGDIIEFGVFKGVGMMYWRKLLEIFAPGSVKRVVGFDTFVGYSESCCDYEQEEKQKFMDQAAYIGTDIDSLKACFAAGGMENNIEFVAGDVVKTAKKYVEENVGARVSLLHLDLDTYEGTKAALEAFYPVVSRGGIVILDEYGKRGWGESDAVDEFFAAYPDVKIESVPFSEYPTAYVVKK